MCARADELNLCLSTSSWSWPC